MQFSNKLRYYFVQFASDVHVTFSPTYTLLYKAGVRVHVHVHVCYIHDKYMTYLRTSLSRLGVDLSYILPQHIAAVLFQ